MFRENGLPNLQIKPSATEVFFLLNNKAKR